MYNNPLEREIFINFIHFGTDAQFNFKGMDVNDDLRHLLIIEDALKEVNMELLCEWERFLLNDSMNRLTQREANLIHRVIMTLQECERKLVYLREIAAENATCPKCGKPYFKDVVQAHEDRAVSR